MSRPRRSPDGPTIAEHFGDLRADYSAAKHSRFRRRRSGYARSGSGADYHYRSDADYLRMMELARDMDRNDVIIGQVIDRSVDNTVQDGITLDVTTGDDGLNRELDDRWWAWAEDPDQCDLAGECDFFELERLAMRQPLVDGDTIGLGTSDGPLQLVEAHRCRTPSNTTQNVVHGVLLDDRRRRLEYWLTNDDVDPYTPLSKVGDVRRVPVRGEDGGRQVFHVYNPKRITQTRGVTALAPIVDTAGQFEDLQFAKLIQAQIVSCFAIFREMEATGGGGPNVAPHGEQTTETLADGSTRTLEGIAPGMEIIGRPGETLQGFSPAVPNAEYFAHIKLTLQLIGINLGLPLVMVLMDASETNFSGWRGAIDQARMGFRRNQRSLVRRFHRPVYLWKVRQWLAEDPALRNAALKEGVNVFGHSWSCPTWPYVDPLKDAAGDLLRVRNGLTSQRRRAAERGMHWDDLSTEIVDDNALAITKAKAKAREINQDVADDTERVHWRELISLPTPDGVQMMLGQDQNNSGGGHAQPGN